MDDNKGYGKEITFVCKPVENVDNVSVSKIDYEKEYKKMQSRYNKLLDKNKKLEKALISFALKVLEE